MKSIAQKLKQLEVLIDTTDVDARTNAFLKDMVRITASNKGTDWMSSLQAGWLHDLYERHFA